MTSGKLHPFSVVLGIAVVLCLASLGSSSSGTGAVKTVRITQDPDPAAIVRITETQSFVVPNKQILVIKALFHTGFVDERRLLINGVPVLTGGGPSDPDQNPFVLGFPITAQAGDT